MTEISHYGGTFRNVGLCRLRPRLDLPEFLPIGEFDKDVRNMAL